MMGSGDERGRSLTFVRDDPNFPFYRDDKITVANY
jgi:hypothetical protein